MGVYDAPQWLLPAFVRSVQAIGGTAQPEEIRATGEALLARWGAPERRFHNLKHLLAVLARVDELTEETHGPDLVRLAAWYHGAVFDSALPATSANRGGEDETASAVVALRELIALGVPEARARRVHDLVVHLARHTPDPADPDSAVLCDADLAMLAVEPQRYKAYLEDLRSEYAHVPKADFLRARQRILRKLLARTSLFVSPLSERWEEPARQNLSAELARVDKELARLDAEQAGDAAAVPPAVGVGTLPGLVPPGPSTATSPMAMTRVTTPTRPIVAVIPRSTVRTHF
jgi:predicted metal-dependent HD superfamily phosphohydrolase